MFSVYLSAVTIRMKNELVRSTHQYFRWENQILTETPASCNAVDFLPVLQFEHFFHNKSTPHLYRPTSNQEEQMYYRLECRKCAFDERLT